MSRSSTHGGTVLRARAKTDHPTDQNVKCRWNNPETINILWIYIYSKNRTNSTAEMGLSLGHEPPRPVRTTSSTMLTERPYSHTYSCTHTSITLCAPTLHSTCTYAAVLHALSIQIAHQASLYQNTHDTHTHTHTLTHIHIHTQVKTLADTNAI